MCGIAGILDINGKKEIYMDTLKAMASIMRHRGPDSFGVYRDERIGLVHARLSIIDLDGGWQPMHNEDKSVWIAFNGEIFNYIELRKSLEEKGHRFYTTSDTEVIVHLYEDHHVDCLKYLNGQFAFAIWDKNKKELFMARDRLGIRPLFYYKDWNRFYFASEIKAIFATEDVKREIDPSAIDQIFTFWHTVSPWTAFKDVREIPPGHFLIIRNGTVIQEQYWDISFSDGFKTLTMEEAAEELRTLLMDSVRLRLRADVTVGAYLSGGLDSSVTAALMRHLSNSNLKTFSVSFEDKGYDESTYQKEMSGLLGTEQHEVRCAYSDISDNFPAIIWHTEKPIIRTAPAPLFLLSRLVRENNLKVVLTGEGADEVLGGYDIFRETKIRQFWARFPDSRFRPLLFEKLYPYLTAYQRQSKPYRQAFFSDDLTNISDEFYSHRPRWKTTSKTKMFFSEALKQMVYDARAEEKLRATLPSAFREWLPVERAQFIEMRNLLPGYILSSQGDRVAMAHSVEGRFPFLDHRVVEFCAKLPVHYKICGLNEKNILKMCMKSYLPERIVKRSKQPYLAPDAKSFFHDGRVPEYVEDLLSDDCVERYGYFDSRSVRLLLNKCKRGGAIGFKDNMAFVGILSTQLLHAMFIKHFGHKPEGIENIRIMDPGSQSRNRSVEAATG